jgi:nucleoside-diphosphate-sugar epimerase
MCDFTKLKNRTILITGASGLIGLHLLESLKNIKKEYDITIYTWNKTANPEFNYLFEGCNRILCDITEYEDFESLPMFDYIIHSSGYGQPGKFLYDKIKTIEINTSSTIKLLDKLKVDGTFLFVSSSEVYNGLFKYDINEEEIGSTNAQHPRAAYIEGKRCGEAICNIYREKGKNVKVARLSIAYGPGTQHGDTRVINSLIDKGLKNETIELMDDGSSLRTFCYISDVIEMFWGIIFEGKEFIYNVGGVDKFSILEIAEKIGTMLGKKVTTPIINNEVVGNPKLVNLSINKYLKEFGLKKFVSIETGLLNTINWQKKLLENETN